MSLWTPSGGDKPPGAPPTGSGGPTPGAPGSEADMEALRRQLAEAPAEVVVANHCYGLFELAAVYLSQSPPLLAQAQLAIDALGCLVDGLGERLGEPRASLQEALAQVRLAFVQLGAAEQVHQPTDGNGNSTGE